MKKNKAYEDSLSSIFDFIFTEAQKTPDKVKPVKVTGVSSTDAYADVIAGVLENPLLFVNKTTTDALNDVMDFDIRKIRQDPFTPGEDVAIKASNIIDVLNNDMSFIDKQFKRFESNRKMGRLAWAGNEIAGLIAANWARKNDLDFDTRMAMLTAGKESTAGYEYATTKARATQLAKEHFGDPNRILTKQQYISRYQSYYTPKGGLSAKDLAGQEYDKTYKRWLDTYQAGEAQGPGKGIKGLDGVTKDRSFYAFMERDNLMNKAYQARVAGDYTKSGNLMKSAGFVEALNNRNYTDVLREKKMRTLDNYSRRIDSLERADPVRNRAKIQSLQSKMKGINKDLRVMNRINTSSRLGEIEGTLKSIQDVWGYTVGGGLVPAIMSGDFYKPYINTAFGGALFPVKDEKLGLGFADKDGDEWQITVKVARKRTEEEIKNKFIRKVANDYDQLLTDIYYLTPGGLIGSLATGEIFAYRALRLRDKAQAKFTGLDFNRLFKTGDEAYLRGLAGTMNPSDFRKLEKIFKKNKRYRELAKRFNVLDRHKERVKKLLAKHLFKESSLKEVREKVMNGILKLIGESDLAREILSQWVEKGGFKVFLQGVRVAAKEAAKAFLDGVSAGLARVLGPVVDFVIDQVINLAIKIGEKTLKPLLKLITTLFVFACSGCLVFVIIFVGAIFGKFSHIVPQQVQECSPDFTVEVPYGGTIPDVLFEGSPLPDGVTCLYGPQQTGCSQGPGGSYSHGNLIAIDVTNISYFYTPTFCDVGLGNCVLISTRPYPCGDHAGDEVVFTAEYGGHTYKFILVHTKLNPEYSPGDTLGPGVPIGRIQEYEETYTCSTGKHLHLELVYDGTKVNPQDVMTNDPSSGGFGCNTTPCP